MHPSFMAAYPCGIMHPSSQVLLPLSVYDDLKTKIMARQTELQVMSESVISVLQLTLQSRNLEVRCNFDNCILFKEKSPEDSAWLEVKLTIMTGNKWQYSIKPHNNYHNFHILSCGTSDTQPNALMVPSNIMLSNAGTIVNIWPKLIEAASWLAEAFANKMRETKKPTPKKKKK